MIPDAQLPGFVPASDIPSRNLTREEELEEQVRQSKAETLRVLELLGSEPARNLTTGPKPQEWQALQTVLSDLLEANRDLHERLGKQGRQIEELKNTNKQLQRDVHDIRELAKESIDGIKSEVASCKQLIDDFSGRLALDIALDRQRLAKLEHPEINSRTNVDRAEKIKEYLAENGTPGKFRDKRNSKMIEGKAVRFELLRSYLDCDKWQLNHALRALFRKYPGEYCKRKLNKTTWLLVERPKL